MHSKGNHKQKEKNLKIGENITDKGLISKIHTQLMKLNINFFLMGGGSKSTFVQRHIDGQKKKHMKRCSTLLIHREMQIKTTKRYHLILVRTDTIKKSTNNRCGEGVEKRKLPALPVGV